jgi:hypothetical protein
MTNLSRRSNILEKDNEESSDSVVHTLAEVVLALGSLTFSIEL